MKKLILGLLVGCTFLLNSCGENKNDYNTYPDYFTSFRNSIFFGLSFLTLFETLVSPIF